MTGQEITAVFVTVMAIFSTVALIIKKRNLHHNHNY